jgi:regulator of protease activity HflC (stomatin/prohibitin superfamily)
MVDNAKLVRRLVLSFFGLIILLILVFGSFATVNSGYVGVVTTFGKVTSEMQPGVHLKWPIVQSVTAMNVQVQKDQTDETAATNDLQDVTTTVALNYHLNHAQVDNIFVNLTAQYQDNFISPIVSEAVKSATAKYTAEQLLTERPAVTTAIENDLVAKLQPHGIVVDQFSVVNFAFSQQFTSAIEAKQAAQQQAEQAQFTLQKAQLDAQANQVQDAALTPAILEQQAISKWDGKMPTTVSGSASIFSIPVGQ